MVTNSDAMCSQRGQKPRRSHTFCGFESLFNHVFPWSFDPFADGLTLQISTFRFLSPEAFRGTQRVAIPLSESLKTPPQPERARLATSTTCLSGCHPSPANRIREIDRRCCPFFQPQLTPPNFNAYSKHYYNGEPRCRPLLGRLKAASRITA